MYISSAVQFLGFSKKGDFVVDFLHASVNVVAGQVVQNTGIHLLTGKKKQCEPLFINPVNIKMPFKVLLIVFKCLNGLAPSYLS